MGGALLTALVACTSDDDTTVGLDAADAATDAENAADSSTQADASSANDAAVATFSVSGKVTGLAGDGSF